MSDAAPPPLRIGILGAAKIAPMAMIKPAGQVPEATVVAVAARDRARAEKFAAKHGIEKVHDDYQAIVDDPEIDAVYVPLAIGMHYKWTDRALRAGKHVLCEKPITGNADEAEQLADLAESNGLVLMEALHWRYHALAARMKEIMASGELGNIKHIEAHLCIPVLSPKDKRFDYGMAGGATMDVGCYPVSMVRHLAEAEPEVVSARAKLVGDQIDRRMDADLRFADGRTAKIICALRSMRPLDMSARVEGDAGEMRVLNPVAPQLFHRMKIRTTQGKRKEKVPGEPTYNEQLRAFVDAVRNGSSPPTNARDAVANMRVIDAIYRAAGLKPRVSCE